MKLTCFCFIFVCFGLLCYKNSFYYYFLFFFLLMLYVCFVFRPISQKTNQTVWKDTLLQLWKSLSIFICLFVCFIYLFVCCVFLFVICLRLIDGFLVFLFCFVFVFVCIVVLCILPKKSLCFYFLVGALQLLVC